MSNKNIEIANDKDLERYKSRIKEVVKIIPEKFIVFQCEDDEPMGEVRITVVTTPSYPPNLPDLEFELMCTNKENYKVENEKEVKVSNCKGKINKDCTSHLIRIYIKNIDNLEKCLSDKFRIRVFGTFESNKEYENPDNVLLVAKLKVLIEKHKQTLKIDEMNSNITQAVSRTASLYTSPSIYTNPSAFSSTAVTDPKSIIYFSRVLANEQKKISTLQLREQTLNDVKMEFDESNKKYYNKEKELKNAQNNYQKNKAKEKFCMILLVTVFLISIVLGFVFKKIIKSDIWENTYSWLKNDYFN